MLIIAQVFKKNWLKVTDFAHSQTTNKLVNKAGNDSARVSGQDSKKPPAPRTSQIAGFGGFRPFASLEKNNTSVLLFRCFLMVELNKCSMAIRRRNGWRNESTGQKWVRGFHQGFQTPRNGWKHDAEGGVLLMFRGVWNPWWKTKHEFLSWLVKLVWEFSGIISEE